MSAAPILAILITIVVGIVAINNWRWGLLCVVAVGVLQDVLRKLTPDVPSYFTIWAFLVFGLVLVCAFLQGEMGKPRRLWLGDQKFKFAFQLYFALIAFQSVHSLVRWGSPLVPLSGILFYLGPMVVLLLVISFGDKKVWVQRFLYVYLWIMVPTCLTVYFSYYFDGSMPALRDIGSFVGAKLIIYDVGTVLYSYPGLLRVGEITAFHAATCIAFLTILILEFDRSLALKLLYGALIAGLIGAIFLTGRRKMLMAITIFWFMQFILISVLRNGRSRGTNVLLGIGGVVFFAMQLLDDDGGVTSAYVVRGASVFSDSIGRLETAIDLFFSAVNRSGGMGLGTGVASQALRYAGVDLSRHVGGAAESGIGYLALELGIAGVLIVMYLGMQAARVFVRKIRFVGKLNDSSMLYAASFVAYLIAQLATFANATQLYGDYFVLITLGIVGGAAYAIVNDSTRRILLIASIRSKLMKQRMQRDELNVKG